MEYLTNNQRQKALRNRIKNNQEEMDVINKQLDILPDTNSEDFMLLHKRGRELRGMQQANRIKLSNIKSRKPILGMPNSRILYKPK